MKTSVSISSTGPGIVQLQVHGVAVAKIHPGETAFDIAVGNDGRIDIIELVEPVVEEAVVETPAEPVV